MLAALGVVFGDIGTSPLYALQTVFSIDHGAVHPTAGDVYGVISLMFWSVTLIVSIKYVGVLMRADNDGEGGVMALAALARRLYADRPRAVRRCWSPRHPRGLAVLRRLADHPGDQRAVRRRGPGGRRARAGTRRPAGGGGHPDRPVRSPSGSAPARSAGSSARSCCCGSLALAAAGLREVIAHPARAAGPVADATRWCSSARHPVLAFVAMGAVVLVITGAEALYADMGHFGRPPILRAWFFVVFPALDAELPRARPR